MWPIHFHTVVRVGCWGLQAFPGHWTGPVYASRRAGRSPGIEGSTSGTAWPVVWSRPFLETAFETRQTMGNPGGKRHPLFPSSYLLLPFISSLWLWSRGSLKQLYRLERNHLVLNLALPLHSWVSCSESLCPSLFTCRMGPVIASSLQCC